MLVTSIFSFSHNVFYTVKDRNHHFSHIILSSANAFNLVTPKILSFGKELKFELSLSPEWQESVPYILSSNRTWTYILSSNKTWTYILSSNKTWTRTLSSNKTLTYILSINKTSTTSRFYQKAFLSKHV